MNRFVCRKCGKACYSAARLVDMRDDKCPYEGCVGHVVPDDEVLTVTKEDAHDEKASRT